MKLNDNDEIDSVEIDIGNKTDRRASVEEIKTKDVLLANVLGFDAVYLKCSPCNEKSRSLNLKYLINAASGKFKTKKMKMEKKHNKWTVVDGVSNKKIDLLKFTSNKVLGILVGVEKVLVNPAH